MKLKIVRGTVVKGIGRVKPYDEAGDDAKFYDVPGELSLSDARALVAFGKAVVVEDPEGELDPPQGMTTETAGAVVRGGRGRGRAKTEE